MSSDPRLGTQLGPYRLEDPIGRGGMGVVYLARDLRLDRRVAVKVMAQELASDPSFRDRFEREARMAAAIDHPNIIPVYDTGEESGVLYLAMRYVPGTDLKSLLLEDGALPTDRTVSIMRQVASALDAAHQQGLVHRDVKPANILLAAGTGGDEIDHVYLTDFGLTKRFSQASRALTATGQFVGTIDYVAPEQVEGQTIDGRADQYSLACVMFECLTGVVVFGDTSDVATLFAHVQQPPPPVTSYRPDLPMEVDGVMGRAMAKRPADRFATCAEFVTEIRRALAAWGPERKDRTDRGGGVASPPPPPPPFMAPPGPGPSMPSMPPAPAEPEVEPTVAAPAPTAPQPSPPETAPPGPPREAPPERPAPREPSRPRRRGALVGIGAAVAVALVAGGVVFALTRGNGTPGPEASGSGGPTGPASPSGTGPPAVSCSGVPTTSLADASEPSEQIFVMDAGGGKAVRLSRGSGDHGFPSFSPDCTQLAFAQSVGGNKDIFSTNVDGTGIRRLTTNPSAEGQAEWSPDGASIVFSSKRGASREVYVMDADGAHETRLTHDPGDDAFPAWTPSGSSIVFTSTRNGDTDVYKMPREGGDAGGDVQQLTFDAAAERDPSVSPDDRSLLYSSDADGNRDVLVMDLGTGDVTNLTNNPAEDWNPAWSPDGKRIVFASDRPGNFEIFVMNADGSGLRRLTRDPRVDHNPSFSPDGTRIVFNRGGSVAE